MRKLILILLFIPLFSLHGFSKKHLLKGKIINVKDTTVVTFIIPINFFTKIPVYETIQHRIKYYDSDSTKKTITPEIATEIQFTYEREKVRMVSMANTLGLKQPMNRYSNNIFFKLEVEGYLSLYRYFHSKSFNGPNNSSYTYKSSSYFFQKKGEQLTSLLYIGYKTYFSDCPQLIQKKKSKEFKWQDIDLVVKFYNENCAPEQN